MVLCSSTSTFYSAYYFTKDNKKDILEDQQKTDFKKLNSIIIIHLDLTHKSTTYDSFIMFKTNVWDFGCKLKVEIMFQYEPCISKISPFFVIDGSIYMHVDNSTRIQIIIEICKTGPIICCLGDSIFLAQLIWPDSVDVCCYISVFEGSLTQYWL